MAIDIVETDTKFNEWRVITNLIISAVGDNDLLSTVEKSSLVGALNEIATKIGVLSSLNTSAKSSSVAAINEIFTLLGINSSLTTTQKASVVAAINELDGEVGVLSTLNTSSKTTIVSAINELQQEILDNDSDISDLLADIGDATSITTTASDLSSAINELNLIKISQSNVPNQNVEINHGRFSAESSKALTTFDDTSRIFVEYNSSVFSQGEKFINDNADFGGAGGSLGADMLALLTEMNAAGRVDRRNGYEFYILDITGGGGTADGVNISTIDYYPVCTTDDSILGSIKSYATVEFWLRLETLATPANNGIIIGDGTVSTYIDGVLSNNALIDVSDGWVHVRQTALLETEYKQLFPAIYSNVGDVINVALPCLYSAIVDNNIHVGVV